MQMSSSSCAEAFFFDGGIYDTLMWQEAPREDRLGEPCFIAVRLHQQLNVPIHYCQVDAVIVDVEEAPWQRIKQV